MKIMRRSEAKKRARGAAVLVAFMAAVAPAMAHDVGERSRERARTTVHRHGQLRHGPERVRHHERRHTHRVHGRRGHVRHHHAVAPARLFRPVRVAYYRPRAPRTYVTLSSPWVLVHGPRVSARVVAYPGGGTVLYADGYCPAAVHYHPVAPEPRPRVSVHLRLGF